MFAGVNSHFVFSLSPIQWPGFVKIFPIKHLPFLRGIVPWFPCMIFPTKSTKKPPPHPIWSSRGHSPSTLAVPRPLPLARPVHPRGDPGAIPSSPCGTPHTPGFSWGKIHGTIPELNGCWKEHLTTDLGWIVFFWENLHKSICSFKKTWNIGVSCKRHEAEKLTHTDALLLFDGTPMKFTSKKDWNAEKLTFHLEKK